jgi:hypothetical protein
VRADRLFGIAVLTLLTVLVILRAGVSLAWRFGHDTSILFYQAYLIDVLGYLPYRDFWDINLPGTYLAHVLLGRLTGYSTGIRLRVTDLLYLGALLTVSSVWLRPLGRRVAWSAAVLFAAIYLGTDYGLLFEREYLALLPIVLAALLATRAPRLPDLVRCAAIGLLFGVVATMKPHLAVALPVVLVFALLEIRARAPSRSPRGSRIVLLVVSALAAAALPPAIAVTWLMRSGVWPWFLKTVRGYYPIYAYVTTNLDVILPGRERTLYVIRSLLRCGGHWMWLAPAALGLFAAFRMDAPDPRRKRQILLLCALTSAYGVYPAFTGQYFGYHWIPFLFFLLGVVSLCFLDVPGSIRPFARWVLPLGVVITIGSTVGPELAAVTGRYYLEGIRPIHPSGPAVQVLGDFLKLRLLPGDRVQALDWVNGGVLEAMLAARAETATPYIADVVFYLDVSDPYVRGIREDFLQRMRGHPPRFIVEFVHDSWMSGPGATGEFVELRRLIDEGYRVVLDLSTHRIYERLDSRHGR